MLSRLRARKEWQFFGVLVKADRALALAWWTALVLRGLLPAAFAIAMGALELALEVDSGRHELAAQTVELWRVAAPLRDGGIVQ